MLQLTPEEAAEYKDTPVVYNGDIGFFFEPNELSLTPQLTYTFLLVLTDTHHTGRGSSKYAMNSRDSRGTSDTDRTERRDPSWCRCRGRTRSTRRTRTRRRRRPISGGRSRRSCRGTRISRSSTARSAGAPTPRTPPCSSASTRAGRTSSSLRATAGEFLLLEPGQEKGRKRLLNFSLAFFFWGGGVLWLTTSSSQTHIQAPSQHRQAHSRAAGGHAGRGPGACMALAARHRRRAPVAPRRARQGPRGYARLEPRSPRFQGELVGGGGVERGSGKEGRVELVIISRGTYVPA